LSKKSPIVPTSWWRSGLIAAYAPILTALGASGDACSTQNDGSLYVDVDTSLEAIESAGAFPLSESPTARGWHIVCDAGLAWAKDRHPSEGKVTPTASASRELTPEEKARAEKRKALRERMEQIRTNQQMDAEDNE